MKKICLYISVILLFSCSVIKDKPRCEKYFYDSFVVNTEKVESIIKNDTLVFNELRYECLHSTFYTGKVMYEKFGKWNKAHFSDYARNPVLMWEDVDLFKNGKLYDVLTFGKEDYGYTYSSIMIFDEDNNDLFAKESEEKQQLTNYFGELIKNQDRKKMDFFNAYNKLLDLKYNRNTKSRNKNEI